MSEEVEHQQGEQEPRASDFEDYDEFTAAIAAHKARQVVREELAPKPPPKTASDLAWEQAVDEQGNYRSLGHMLRYVEASPAIPQGCPINPYRYSSEQQDVFEEDLKNWKLAQSIGGALRQRPQPQLSPFFDDELAGRRAEILARAQRHHKERILAEARGDKEAVELHAYHGRAAEKELEALPKSKGQEQYEEALVEHTEKNIDKLYNERDADSPHWQDERLQHDSAVELIRRNSIARVNEEGVGVVKLVQLDSPWGNPLPTCPKNMCRPIELPRQVFEQFKREVRSDDPDKYFRQAHAFLERHGYGSYVEPAFGSSEEVEEAPEKKEKPRRNYESMSFKEFEKVRAEEERKKGRMF